MCVEFGLKILHKTLHRVGFRGGVYRVVVKQKYKCRIGRKYAKTRFSSFIFALRGTLCC